VPPPPADRDWVDYTLFDSQAGYSDYYATAMVVLLRSSGIPARVVSGFAPGEFDENEGAYIVYESEAHSWVEVFFPRYGWINFEPSSLRALPFRAADEQAINPDLSLAEGGGEMLDPFFEEMFGDLGGEYLPMMPERQDRPWIVALALLLGLGALAGLLYLALMAIFRRGLKALPWHAQWYAQLRRLASWAGLAGRASQTPFEYARWLDERFPGTGRMVRPIADCYVEGAYGGRQPDPETLAQASKAWDDVRRPLARRVLLRGVIAARDRYQALLDHLDPRRAA
jgi:hypothetical protein